MNILQNGYVDSRMQPRGSLLSAQAPRVFAMAALLVCGLFSAVSHAKEAAVEENENTLRPMDEIVVTAERAAEPNGNFEKLLETSLKARLDEKIAQIEMLREESAWREDEEDSAADKSDVELGYDPRDHERDGVPGSLTDLPLEIVVPATIISIDY